MLKHTGLFQKTTKRILPLIIAAYFAMSLAPFAYVHAANNGTEQRTVSGMSEPITGGAPQETGNTISAQGNSPYNNTGSTEAAPPNTDSGHGAPATSSATNVEGDKDHLNDVQGPRALGDTYADAFPDEFFREYVLGEIFNGLRTDDDEISESDLVEMAGLTELIMSEMDISDLTGIEYFSGLKILDVSSNQLTALVLTWNTALEELYAARNQISTLDISGNLRLTVLCLSENLLTGIDLSSNTSLLELQLFANQLSTLDISANTKLEMLDVGDNKLTGLDVTKNTALVILFADRNYMNSTDDVIGWKAIGLIEETTFIFLPQKLTVPLAPIYDGDGRLSWNAGANAQWYYIQVEGHKYSFLVSEHKNVTTYDLREVLRSLSYYATKLANQTQLEIRLFAAEGNSLDGAMSTSDVSDPCIVEIPQLLDTPVVSYDTDGYTLKWDAVAGADGYIVCINGEGRKRVAQAGSIVTTDLSDLRLSYGEYNVQVRAVYVEGFSISPISDFLVYEVGRLEVDWSELDRIIPQTATYGDSHGDILKGLSTAGKANNGLLNGTFSVVNPLNILAVGARTITIEFTVTSEGRFKGTVDKKDYRITVGKKPLSSDFIKFKTSQYTYTGSAITPDYNVADNSLIKSSDYTESVLGNTKVNDNARVVITATSSGNYTGSATGSFRIVQATPSGVPTYTTITTPECTLADAKLKMPSNGFVNPIDRSVVVEGKLTWDKGDKEVVQKNVAYRWTFTPDDTRNYLPVSSIIMPYGELAMPLGTGQAAETQLGEGSEGGFTDVAEGVWYEEAVLYMYERKLMNGTSVSPMLFSPETYLSRAMIVTILYRQEGTPDVAGLSGSFIDVPEDTWYTDAVTWAAEYGIVNGYPGGRFGPEDNITRQDLAAILIRYADSKEINLPYERGYPGFDDEQFIAEYAMDAIRRCYESNIINGRYFNMFDPLGNATRAEAAAMLFRFLRFLPHS